MPADADHGVATIRYDDVSLPWLEFEDDGGNTFRMMLDTLHSLQNPVLQV